MSEDPTVTLANLREAFQSGVLTVAYEGKSTTFRSFAEMAQAIASLQNEIAGTGQSKPGSARHPVIRSSKGW